MLSNLALLSLLTPSAAVLVLPSFGSDLVTSPFGFYRQPTFWPSSIPFHDELSLFARPNLFRQLRHESLSSTLEQLARTLDDKQPTFTKRWSDVGEHAEAKLQVRGLTADQLTAEVEDGVLTVRGESTCESCRSVVSRSLPLPFDVSDAASQIELHLDDGILTVRVPKTARVPQPTPTALRIIAAEPAAKEKKETEKDAALPSPSPAAVEADALKQLEEKFPSAPTAPAPTTTEAPSPDKPTTEAKTDHAA